MILRNICLKFITCGKDVMTLHISALVGETPHDAKTILIPKRFGMLCTKMAIFTKTPGDSPFKPTKETPTSDPYPNE